MIDVTEAHEQLAECKAHVARLESELTELRQRYARDQKESLEHVRKACAQRDEASTVWANAEADLLHARRALTETEKDMGASLSIQTQLRKELDKAKQALSDIAQNCEVQCLVSNMHESTPKCDDVRPCLACLASAQMQGYRRDLEQARDSLRASDRDITTAIERARVAEAHAALAKKERDEAREQLRQFRLDKDTTAHVERFLPNGQTRGVSANSGRRGMCHQNRKRTNREARTYSPDC